VAIAVPHLLVLGPVVARDPGDLTRRLACREPPSIRRRGLWR